MKKKYKTPEKKRAYQRAYYQAHKEKAREYHKRYYQEIKKKSTLYCPIDRRELGWHSARTLIHLPPHQVINVMSQLIDMNEPI